MIWEKVVSLFLRFKWPIVYFLLSLVLPPTPGALFFVALGKFDTAASIARASITGYPETALVFFPVLFYVGDFTSNFWLVMISLPYIFAIVGNMALIWFLVGMARRLKNNRF